MEEKEWKLRTRAIFGGLRNMASDCLEGLRPKVQYMHYFRSLQTKIYEQLKEIDGKNLDQDMLVMRDALVDILSVYSHLQGPPTNKDSKELSKRFLGKIKKYGYKPNREIKDGK